MTEVILVAWVQWLVFHENSPMILAVCWIIQKATYRFMENVEIGDNLSSIYFALQNYSPQFMIWRAFEMASTYKKP